MVDETSGTLLGRTKHGLTLDHFSLNKFSGPMDGNFVAVSNTIQDLFEKVVNKNGSSPRSLVARQG